MVGVGAGLGAVFFRWLIQGFHLLFFDGGAQALGFLGRYYVILLPAAGGIFVGLVGYYLAKEVKGHSVPEVIEAVSLRGGRIPPRVGIAQALASSICIGSGGSAGLHGPVVSIGAAMSSALGQWLHLRDDDIRTLVACGAAGGISATFNAPIAGVFFALEVILGKFSTRGFSLVVLSSVMADILAHGFFADLPPLSAPRYTLVSAWEIPFYAFLGILSALAALAFIYSLFKTEDLFDSTRIPAYLRPALGGLMVGGLGLAFPVLFGVGYEGVEQALGGQLGLLTLLALAGLKIIATSVTLGSGGSGGIFAPSLFIGAMLGGTFGEVAHLLFPSITAASGAYALVGMGAVFAGVTRAPITSIIILFEITRDYAIILPLMTAVVISTTVSQFLYRESIYTLKLRRRGIELAQEPIIDPLQSVTVAEAMTRRFETVPASMPVRELIKKFAQTGQRGFPVVDEANRLAGIVTTTDVTRSAVEGSGDLDLTVDRIATKSVLFAFPHQTLHEALRQGDSTEVSMLPVVDSHDQHRLVGVLHRRDILKAYVGVTRKQAELQERMQHLRTEGMLGTKFVETEINAGSPVADKRLRELALPKDCIVVSIRRGGRVIIPRGDTLLQSGDRVALFTTPECEAAALAVLGALG